MPSVTGALSADGDIVLDLSSLADGPLTTSVTATDANAAQTTIAGPGLTLSSAPPPPNPTPIDSGFDADTGGFNRHADGKAGCAFLESGGILVEALAWLYARTGETALLEAADRIAGYSYRHRDPVDGRKVHACSPT